MTEIDNSLPAWEKGLLLAEVLSEAGATKDAYFAYLDNVTEESVFSSFNLRRFLQYFKEVCDLDKEKYYWVVVSEGDAWEVAFLNDMGEFEVISEIGSIAIEDIYLVDLNPITREEK